MSMSPLTILVISIVQWIVDGRKNFKGPQVEIVGEGILDPSSRNGYAEAGKLDEDVEGGEAEK